MKNGTEGKCSVTEHIAASAATNAAPIAASAALCGLAASTAAPIAATSCGILLEVSHINRQPFVHFVVLPTLSLIHEIRIVHNYYCTDLDAR